MKHNYKSGNQTLDMRLSLRYSIGKVEKGSATVGIQVDNYYVKDLRLANEMFELLKKAIPFAFTISKEPEVFVMGPPCREHMLLVKMTIEFTDVPNAEELLKGADFWEGFESH